MASQAAARRPEEAPRRDQAQRPAPRAARPAPQARARAASRARLSRALIVFVICFAVLAAGRVAMSFAVVQKTVATDSIAREERRLAAENAQLTEELAELGSTVRIRDIAQTKLGMVVPPDPVYLTVAGAAAEPDQRP
jgi:cell division protein FtsL